MRASRSRSQHDQSQRGTTNRVLLPACQGEVGARGRSQAQSLELDLASTVDMPVMQGWHISFFNVLEWVQKVGIPSTMLH
jgi:hypothetical protein